MVLVCGLAHTAQSGCLGRSETVRNIPLSPSKTSNRRLNEGPVGQWLDVSGFTSAKRSLMVSIACSVPIKPGTKKKQSKIHKSHLCSSIGIDVNMLATCHLLRWLRRPSNWWQTGDWVASGRDNGNKVRLGNCRPSVDLPSGGRCPRSRAGQKGRKHRWSSSVWPDYLSNPAPRHSQTRCPWRYCRPAGRRERSHERESWVNGPPGPERQLSKHLHSPRGAWFVGAGCSVRRRRNRLPPNVQYQPLPDK